MDVFNVDQSKRGSTRGGLRKLCGMQQSENVQQTDFNIPHFAFKKITIYIHY